MPSPPIKPAPSALRYCGSCCGTLVCWAVWLVLGASLATLTYIAIARELPVPDFVLRRVEARLAEAGFAVEFGRVRFVPSGEMLLEDVRLRSKNFEEPLLTSRLVFVRRSLWSILAGRPVPDEIRLEGAAMQLPAMLSPSGATEPLVRDLAAVLRHQDKRWHLDQLAGRIGKVAVTAHGDYGEPPRAPGRAALTPEEITARFLQTGRRLALAIHRFDAFEEPSLHLRLENSPGTGNTAAIHFTAKGAEHPWAQPLVLGPLEIAMQLSLDTRRDQVVRVRVGARRANFRDQCVAEGVRAVVSARVAPDFASLRPGEAQLALARLTVDDETLLAPITRAELGDWPKVRASLAAQAGGEFLAVEADARLDEKSARLRAEGRGAPAMINRVLAKHTPRAAPYFVFGDPLAFAADAEFGAGWRFERLAARVAGGRLDSRGVKITSLRGRIAIVGRDFLASDAQVTMGENFAQGSYWMDLGTSDYRMLLNGRLRPAEINGWFRGDWWLNFWNQRFAFSAAPPEADVDVQGRWRDQARTEFFGRATVKSAGIWGGGFDEVRTLVFLRPHFTHVIDFTGTQGADRRLDGNLKRFADPVTRETNRLEFDATGNVSVETYGRMLEGKADELLATLRLTRPPQAQAKGSIIGKWPGAVPDYTFTGRAEGGLHYFGFPLETAQVTGHVRGNDVRLEDVKFTAAGGTGAGNATLNGSAEARLLGFDLYLNGADLARTIRAVEEYEANATGQKAATATDSKFMKRASGGRLDLALSAQGRPGEIASFDGTGNAKLGGIELAEVHLFGLLSQVLSGLSLSFSSLKLDQAHASYRLHGGRLNFTDLKVTGPSAEIDARGEYVFATNTLDFTAKFEPFKENKNLLTLVVDLVTKPFISILELRLTGPLSNPEWSFTVGSSAPTPEPAAAPAPEKTPVPTSPK